MGSKKRILLVTVLLLPSLLYFFFELSEANFKKMAYYGPKKYDAEIKDTVYYSVPLDGFLNYEKKPVVLDTNSYPVFLVAFLHDEFRKDGFKLNGLLELTQYKPEKLNHINILMVSSFDSVPLMKKAELKIHNKDIEELFCSAGEFKKMNEAFFKNKPVHVFPYFFALIDKKRNIRGYYDPTYVSEVKRMIQEFEHLKLRDEKAKLVRKNTIHTKQSGDEE